MEVKNEKRKQKMVVNSIESWEINKNDEELKKNKINIDV